jgi:hypothetical protein
MSYLLPVRSSPEPRLPLAALPARRRAARDQGAETDAEVAPIVVVGGEQGAVAVEDIAARPEAVQENATAGQG